MRVLVACEFSGTVRNAFLEFGHDAWSCDLQPTESETHRHIIGDFRSVLEDGWDLLIAHPPCTRLTVAGVRWLTERSMWNELQRDCDLFSAALNAPVPKICVENPLMHHHAKKRIRNFREYDQIMHPWWFGDPFNKRTCLWLKGLPILMATNPVHGHEWILQVAPGPKRAAERSRTFRGMAMAMAEQWGDE